MNNILLRRAHLTRWHRLLPENGSNQGRNQALTVLYVPSLLRFSGGSGWEGCRRRARHPSAAQLALQSAVWDQSAVFRSLDLYHRSPDSGERPYKFSDSKRQFGLTLIAELGLSVARLALRSAFQVHKPSKWVQIVFLSPRICKAASRNPASCRTHQGTGKRRFDPTLRTGGCSSAPRAQNTICGCVRKHEPSWESETFPRVSGRLQYRCRGNMAHMRQSRPDSGLGCQAKVLIPFQYAISSLGSGLALPVLKLTRWVLKFTYWVLKLTRWVLDKICQLLEWNLSRTHELVRLGQRWAFQGSGI